MARGRTVKSEPSASATMEDTDDDISVTSTPYDSEDPDAEYNVEDILAQDDDMDGVTKYLVRWSNYPLEKCTWEPEENMGRELLEDLWEDKKKRPDYKPFDLSLYFGALADKEARHLRRNVKRKRLGLPETEPVSLDDDVFVSQPDTGAETGKEIAYPGTGQDSVSAPVEPPSASHPVGATEPANETGIPTRLVTDLTNDSGDDGDELVVLDAISAPATPKLKKKKKKKKEDSPKDKAESKRDKTLSKKDKAVSTKDKSEPTKDRSVREKDKSASKDDSTASARDKIVFTNDKTPSTKGKPVSSKDKPDTAAKPVSKGNDRDVVESGPSRTTTSFSATLATSGVLPGTPKRVEKRKSTDDEKSADNAGVAKTSKGPSGGARRVSEPGPSAESLQRPKVSTTASNKEPTTVENPGQSSGTASRKPSTFLAKRSATTPQAAGNAFNSGEKIRTGRTLLSSMADPSKAQQLFTKRSLLRKAELIQRDKADAAIEPSRLSGLFPISQGPPRTSAALSPKIGNASSPVLEPTPTVEPAQGPTRSILARRHSENVPKRKKSVHFSDAGDGDDGPSSGRVLKSPPAVDFAAASDENDIAMDISPIESQNSGVTMPERAITLLAGPRTEPVEAVLSVVAETHTPEIRIDDVFYSDVVRFEYSCLADTLLQQLGSLRERNLFSGDIKASPQMGSSGEKLETISQKLRAMSSGLFFLKPTFAILLYPSRCPEWNEEIFGFPIPRAGQAAGSLRYVVFKTYFDGSGFLRPHNGTTGGLAIPSNVSEREHLMRVFNGLDRDSYTRLFARRDGPRKLKRNVFLAYPPSLFSSMQQLALWVHTMEPGCAVFDSSVPGAWMAFRDKILLDSEDGAIIIHELAISAVRRFPDLNNLISKEDGMCRIWGLSQSILSPPVFTPLEVLSLDEPSVSEQADKLARFGKITWTQLFPHGLALFVTPSFIVSEPRRTYDLFRWICTAHRVGDILVTLVTAWDICGYLKLIADDMFSQRTKIPRGNAQKAGPGRREPGTYEKDFDMECHLRYETCLLASEICETQETAFFTPTVFADQAIDWNDEQSLVNWFGWWSSTHLDQYRLFHVVGTDMALKYHRSDLATRTMALPVFSPDTVADPDAAREQLQQSDGPVAHIFDKTDGSSQTKLPNNPSQPTQAVRSQRFPDDSAHNFTKYLMGLNDSKNLWRIYGYAVFWRDSNEAFKLGSLTSNTIKDWLSFTWPFTNKAFRSYVGFFYLPDDACDSLPANKRDRLPRHPFVVIYRPSPPNFFPYKKTELIFWDPRAPQRMRGRDMLFETSDLTAGQRAVLDHVRKKGPEKNKNLPLSCVYIGGRPHRRNDDRRDGALSSHANELDATLEFLDTLEYDFKDLMPPSRNLLEARGFKEVIMNDDARAEMNQERAGTGGQTGAKEANGVNDNTAVVFHAPRGGRLRHVGTSKCDNRFFTAARQARMRNPRATTMEFEYRPTVEWYQEQVEEGRSYGHIRVDGWEPFFKTFKIGLVKIR